MIDWGSISIDMKKVESAILGQTVVKYIRVKLPYPMYGIGIDPGKNFGLAICNGKYLDIFWGTMKTYPKPDRWRYGIEAVHIAGSVKSIILGNAPLDMASPKKVKMVAIDERVSSGAVEGAAYKKREGQVNLAEVRFGFALGLYDNGFDVKIVPPATARKAATGNGNDRMADYWPLLNNNACDAVGIAAFAAGYSAQGGK
jgi:hypothetical protein